MYINVNTSDP